LREGTWLQNPKEERQGGDVRRRLVCEKERKKKISLKKKTRKGEEGRGCAGRKKTAIKEGKFTARGPEDRNGAKQVEPVEETAKIAHLKNLEKKTRLIKGKWGEAGESVVKWS